MYLFNLLADLTEFEFKHNHLDPRTNSHFHKTLESSNISIYPLYHINPYSTMLIQQIPFLPLSIRQNDSRDIYMFKDGSIHKRFNIQVSLVY